MARTDHPRIRIGGNDPQPLTLAANDADIVGLTGITVRRGGTEPDRSAWKGAVIDDRVQLVREAAGDRYERLELNALLQRVIINGQSLEGCRGTDAPFDTVISVAEILQSPSALVGTVDQLVGDLQARRMRWGLSYFVTDEPYMNALVPAVARLAGR